MDALSSSLIGSLLPILLLMRCVATTWLAADGINTPRVWFATRGGYA
ncbi:hypothetical protein Pla52o_14740 [Novipirellula galeiformis]|uniref:Uncharacterized protein n=1 Tax=Novipirellula galeiformis TaxID=2528004 RepID=A0A5C6CQ18_9BACT|nr:hypothetical protein Pla52o_14740 [Novipirellula galeiformis]